MENFLVAKERRTCKTIKFLQAQIGVLEFMGSIQMKRKLIWIPKMELNSEENMATEKKKKEKRKAQEDGVEPERTLEENLATLRKQKENLRTKEHGIKSEQYDGVESSIEVKKIKKSSDYVLEAEKSHQMLLQADALSRGITSKHVQ
ncbi:hypothetical protein C5167_008546 [Papaver somniferum]|uniref:Uncharacterized protein n=1 Tax=Papaver somniferum TaxID=3469 RepID=A0A4Y7JXS4_PAPSO|nr:hypothetical protein C5167_008546 [Papaver somniferum]